MKVAEESETDWQITGRHLKAGNKFEAATRESSVTNKKDTQQPVSITEGRFTGPFIH